MASATTGVGSERCDCEQAAHFSPDGAWHPYNAQELGAAPFSTAFGTFRLCSACLDAGHMVVPPGLNSPGSHPSSPDGLPNKTGGTPLVAVIIADPSLVGVFPLGAVFEDQQGDLWMVDTHRRTGDSRRETLLIGPETGRCSAEVLLKKWGPITLRWTPEPLVSGDHSRALRDIAIERSRHAGLGYTDEHDDEHGVAHLVELAFARPMIDWRGGYVRSELVKAASLLVAAIELMDRRSPHHNP